MWKLQKNLILVLILWRLSSVFIIKTAHVPDEYWQSLEVAHKLVFGYGYLTWEWHSGIRSYIYPFLISLLYKVLRVFHLDYVEVLITAPNILQALLSSYGDYRFYMFTNKNKVALFCLCINWYWYYCATRTLINTIESVMTTIALSIFPWKNSETQSTKFVWIVGFLCAGRPTAAIVWFPLCLYHICTSEISRISLVAKYIFIGLTCLSLSTLIDVLHYGRLIITPWKFLQANVALNISDFYGAESFFWYLTSGLPVLLGLQYFYLPVAFWQIILHIKQLHKQAVLCIVIIWTITVYSFLSHKEFRFILPLLPMFIYIICSATSFPLILRKWRKHCIVVFCISHFVPGLYFSLIHQSGSLDAMKVIRNEVSKVPEMSLLLLTPCHATPLYSHIHANISIQFLTCEPNLSNVPGYVDEADQFFAKPMHWLERKYKNETVILPSHLVLFDSIKDKISNFLKQYDIISEIFYSHFPQNNYGRNILIYKHKSINV